MTQTLSERVAAAVRAEVARRKISQGRIASVLDTSQATVSRRLAGTTPFDLDELEQVAGLLGLSVADLLKDAA